MTGRTPARLLAPIALVTTALALFLILTGGGGGDEGSTGERDATAPAQATATATATGRRERPRRRTYTVKSGDTPSGIAEKVGIPLDELLDLNPDVDPQTLSPGQKLRVR